MSETAPAPLPSAAPRERRGPLLAAALTLTYALLLLGRGTPYDLDRLAWFLPASHSTCAALARGQLPTWEPGVFAGFPLHAAGQARALSPPAVVARVVAGLDPLLALDVELLLGLVLAALSGAWAARALGSGPAGAATAGVAWALGGGLGPWQANPAVLGALAPLPAALAAGWLGAWRLMAGAMALAILGGAYQHAALTILAAGLGTACGPAHEGGRARRLAGAGLALLLALGLTAAQWLPTLCHLPSTLRWAGMSPGSRALGLLHPGDLVWAIWPWWPEAVRYSSSNLTLAYAGALGLGLAWLGAREARRPTAGPARLLVGLLGGALGLALLLSSEVGLRLGELPGLGLLRGPGKLLALVHLALALLAARGVDRVALRAPRAAWLLLLCLALDLGQYGQRWQSLVPRETLSARHELVDLVGPGARLCVAGTGAPMAVHLPRDAQGRPDLRQAHPLDANAGLPFGVEHLDGYDPLAPARMMTWSGGPVIPCLRRGAATHLVLSPGHAIQGLWPPLAQRPRWGLFAVPRPLPRARLCSAARVVSGLDEALRALVDLPDEVALVEGPQAAAAAAALQAATGTLDPASLQVTRWAPGDLRLALRLERPALVVLADAALPGWSATLDGAPTPLLVADGVWKAVLCPAGAHELRLAFSAPGLLPGVVLGLLSGLALLLWSRAAQRSTR